MNHIAITIRGIDYRARCKQAPKDLCGNWCAQSLSPSRLHVILALLFVELALLLGSCVLVLLILRHKIIHVALCFRKFHFIHTLAGIPMKEGLAAKHGSEVLCNTL